MEVHRLAMRAGEREIGVEVGDLLATRLVNEARYREAEAICKLTLGLGSDYRILHTLGMAERVLGKTGEARMHFEEALEGCPEMSRDAAPEVVKEGAPF